MQSSSLLMDSAMHVVLAFINIGIQKGVTEAKQGIPLEKHGTDSKARNAKEAKT